MPKQRGRSAGFQMGADHRTKISNSKILNRLIGHAEGSVDMTSTQVTAAIALLDRVMPKLSSTTLDGEVTGSLTLQIVRYADAPLDAPAK